MKASVVAQKQQCSVRIAMRLDRGSEGHHFFSVVMSSLLYFGREAATTEPALRHLHANLQQVHDTTPLCNQRLVNSRTKSAKSFFYTLRATQKMRKGSMTSAKILNPTRTGYCSQESVWIIQTISTMRKRRVNARKLMPKKENLISFFVIALLDYSPYYPLVRWNVLP